MDNNHALLSVEDTGENQQPQPCKPKSSAPPRANYVCLRQFCDVPIFETNSEFGEPRILFCVKCVTDVINAGLRITAVAVSHRLVIDLEDRDYRCCLCDAKLFKIYEECFVCRKNIQNIGITQKLTIEEKTFNWPKFFLRRVVQELLTNSNQYFINVCDRYENTNNKVCIIQKDVIAYVSGTRKLCGDCGYYYADDEPTPVRIIDKHWTVVGINIWTTHCRGCDKELFYARDAKDCNICCTWDISE